MRARAVLFFFSPISAMRRSHGRLIYARALARRETTQPALLPAAALVQGILDAPPRGIVDVLDGQCGRHAALPRPMRAGFAAALFGRVPLPRRCPTLLAPTMVAFRALGLAEVAKPELSVTCAYQVEDEK